MPIWIEPVGVDDAFLDGAGDEGAVVDALAVVRPGILVRVELHQRQRPVQRCMRLEQRPGDKMVAAERQQEGARLDELRRLALDDARRLLVVAGVEQAIAIVDDRHLLEQVAVERILRIVVEDGGGTAYRLRPEAGARPVGDGRVEGNAPDDGVGALDGLGVFPPHEGQRPGIGRVAGAAGQAARGKGVVDGVCRHRLPSRLWGILIRHSLHNCDPLFALHIRTPVSAIPRIAEPAAFTGVSRASLIACRIPSQAEAILMLKSTLAAALLVTASWHSPALSADRSRLDEIRERLHNANRWRDHVMVVAHRGGGMDGDRNRHPENSVAGVTSSIGLGVEMVELDVQKSKDGEFVVFHDSWLDRSSTCHGELAKRTLAELRQCRLVLAGSGEPTAEPIPTLREMLSVTRDRVFVNIDNKLDIDALPDIIAVARDMGMADQIVVKRNLWSAEKIAEMAALLQRSGPGAIFMPIIADDAVRDAQFLEAATSAFSADAVELIAWHKGGEPMTADGGPLFGARARAVAARGDWHLWVNTYAIVNKPAGMLSGGRGDQLATTANLPGEAYGFWVAHGATIIQTDEPAAALGWLTENGYRVPYGSTRPPDTALAASN